MPISGCRTLFHALAKESEPSKRVLLLERIHRLMKTELKRQTAFLNKAAEFSERAEEKLETAKLRSAEMKKSADDATRSIERIRKMNRTRWAYTSTAS